MKMSPVPIRIPDPPEAVEIQMTDGAPITLRRYGNPSGARIVFSHGNGLAAESIYTITAVTVGIRSGTVRPTLSTP